MTDDLGLALAAGDKPNVIGDMPRFRCSRNTRICADHRVDPARAASDPRGIGRDFVRAGADPRRGARGAPIARLTRMRAQRARYLWSAAGVCRPTRAGAELGHDKPDRAAGIAQTIQIVASRSLLPELTT